MKSEVKSAVLSMTGFGAAEGSIGSQKYRIEVKSVNHRFLDLKIRMPRELQVAEVPVRNLVQARFSRGAIDLKIDRVSEGTNAPTTELVLNAELAMNYLEKLRELRSVLGLSDELKTKDIANYPDVLTRGTPELGADEAWKKLEPVVSRALDELFEMRRHEGESLTVNLLEAASELEGAISSLREKRKGVVSRYPDRIREKIKAVFDSYAFNDSSASANVQTILETRIAQELALLVDRTDIEEELVRFQGHLDHLRKVFREGGQVGRKLDFVLQELNREMNTLGNKAQDYGMSEEVVAGKVRLEQLREQVMNLE
ncbi:MAG: YicC family protein [Cryobacterium sp.]|nr:YicC family protein [Oligoflexia bacterium]